MKKQNSIDSLRWAHFSDLHAGSGNDRQLWPRFKTLLFDDLSRSISQQGPIDLIFFSGDVVNRGLRSEFVDLNSRIEEILEVFDRIQALPKLIAVPGNHDLIRPDPLVPEALGLANFWHNKALQAAFWEEKGKPYRALIQESFAEFVEWQDSAIAKGWHVSPITKGLLPGDASYEVKKGAQTFGIIGLNSSWLQLGPQDYEGSLHIDVMQLLELTHNDPDNWVRARDANLIVTHHPASWLSSQGIATWQNDISPTGRFDAHLFGHMHEPLGKSTSLGGGYSENTIQAASLFGLEYLGDSSIQRIQGYSLAGLRVDDEVRTIEIWPRILEETIGRKMKIVPDSAQDIDEFSRSYTIKYEVDRRRRDDFDIVNQSEQQFRETPEIGRSSKIEIDSLRYDLGEIGGHKNIRKVEYIAAKNALEERRFFGLVSDWGMGKNGFLEKIRRDLHIDKTNVFHFDFAEFRSTHDFIEGYKGKTSNSFEAICQEIAEEGPSIIIFANLPPSRDADALWKELPDFLAAVLDFIDEGFVVLHSRADADRSLGDWIDLEALDEADLTAYVRSHKSGGERFCKPEAVSTLYRHTDGIPSKLDAALRDLEFLSLSDLMTTDVDYADLPGAVDNIPQALLSSITALISSEDRSEQRASELLKALSSLPQGERLSRIKRFLGVHPFGPAHARILHDRALIESSALPSMDLSNDGLEKVLVVPRVVREAVRTEVDSEEFEQVDKNALELYFGADWKSGEISGSPLGRRAKKALCDNYEIDNACTLILRCLYRAIDIENELDIEAFVRLSSSFVQILTRGDHFRSAAYLSQRTLAMIAQIEGFEKETSVLKYLAGRSLRMIGKSEEALTSLETLDLDELSKDQRQSAELNLAYILENTDPAKAVEAAKRAIKIAPKSVTALHAKTIVADAMHDAKAKRTRLENLLKEAAKRDATACANNIRLSLASLSEENPSESQQQIRDVIDAGRKGGDFYNSVRAIIKLASAQGAERWLSDREKTLLIEAYHYLYNERLGTLFDQCHDALWRVFEYDDNKVSLFSLFRRSSFIWRLAGKKKKESKFLEKLINKLSGINSIASLGSSRDGYYVIGRVRLIKGDEALKQLPGT
ncbi:MAG: metallophosphoesterase [Erythrobacter sp.]